MEENYSFQNIHDENLYKLFSSWNICLDFWNNFSLIMKSKRMPEAVENIELKIFLSYLIRFIQFIRIWNIFVTEFRILPLTKIFPQSNKICKKILTHYSISAIVKSRKIYSTTTNQPTMSSHKIKITTIWMFYSFR